MKHRNYTGYDAKCFYGFNVAGQHEKTSGGRVKFQILNTIYKNNETDFNIVYLCSSCLPIGIDKYIDCFKKRCCKVVWNQNGVATPASYGREYDVINSRIKTNIHKADWVIYQSDFCKKTADEMIGKVACNLSIIHNAVDINHYAGKQKIKNESCKILVTGSHHYSFRVLDAIKVISILNAKQKHCYKIIIAGNLLWDSLKNCKRQIKQYGKENNVLDDIKIEGRYSQLQALQIYNQADILLHLMPLDPCPTVVIEAMAMGLPVVYDKSGGVVELVGDRCGVGVTSSSSINKYYSLDLNIVAESIRLVKNNLDEYSANCIDHVQQHFNHYKWIQEHNKVFQKVLKQN